MANQAGSAVTWDTPPAPAVLDDIPILYEDEDEGEMGESNPHVVTDEILHICVNAHLAGRSGLQAYSNMNCYYREGPPHPVTGSLPYVSPDLMVVAPFQPLDESVRSYKIGKDGPAPMLVTEILSERSAQQRDLHEKVTIYSKLGVAEYILVDISGKYLPERLLLKRLQPDGTYRDEQDVDGGVTSRLGFRLIIDKDDRLRVIDAATRRRYVRPDEAEAEAAARRLAEERIRELEAELARWRASAGKPEDQGESGQAPRKP